MFLSCFFGAVQFHYCRGKATNEIWIMGGISYTKMKNEAEQSALCERVNGSLPAGLKEPYSRLPHSKKQLYELL